MTLALLLLAAGCEPAWVRDEATWRSAGRLAAEKDLALVALGAQEADAEPLRPWPRLVVRPGALEADLRPWLLTLGDDLPAEALEAEPLRAPTGDGYAAGAEVGRALAERVRELEETGRVPASAPGVNVWIDARATPADLLAGLYGAAYGAGDVQLVGRVGDRPMGATASDGARGCAGDTTLSLTPEGAFVLAGDVPVHVSGEACAAAAPGDPAALRGVLDALLAACGQRWESARTAPSERCLRVYPRLDPRIGPDALLPALAAVYGAGPALAPYLPATAAGAPIDCSRASPLTALGPDDLDVACGLATPEARGPQEARVDSAARKAAIDELVGGSVLLQLLGAQGDPPPFAELAAPE